MEETSGGRPLLHIGAVAERTELSLRTLRHYDEIGLVHPSERSEGGFRLYSEQDVERILLIRRMKPLDFSLEQMRELLDITHDVAKPDPPPEAREKLRELEAIALERRTALERKVAMADEFLDRLRALSSARPTD
ncbi:MerR family transcriptional regulator [Brachybacterium saurashtrense]|uniref:MerR family transcriptional regulator n=1 Tax=Brachybacterium saurashtrense TaxID=556288 RepID=A0A345YRH8_9MICO|nr:MerR family transcriptional regulator [Brachybacterium saurashtrense]AXK46530.1 MerR family transcriptional regulator [Brachybacterium saurashtrense]RRR24271.1 MerR family transcriptional regulator [Brachybacterium saurashtrense]